MKFQLFGNSKKTGGHKFPFNPNRCRYSPGYRRNCAINAFRSIDIISDESYRKLSDYTKEHGGITLCDIVHILRQTYTETKFRFRKMVFDNKSKIELIPDFLIEYCELIELQPNQCIVLSIMSKNRNVSNHIVLLANHESNIYIIDKQVQSETCQESFFFPDEYFKHYLYKESIEELTLYFLEEKIDDFKIPIKKEFYKLIPSTFFDNCKSNDVALSLYENKCGNETPTYPYTDDDESEGEGEGQDEPPAKKTRTTGGKSTKKRKSNKKRKSTKKRK